MSAVRAVAFDFNGTLSHDEPVLYAVYRDLFSEHGRPLTEHDYYGKLAGLSEETIIGTWLGVEGDVLSALVEERIERYLALAGRGETISLAMRDAVSYAAGRVAVAIVSGAFRREIEPVVSGAGLDPYVSVIVAADDVERGKPDPGGLPPRGRTARGEGSRPDEVVAFEDTEAGVASAKAAGLDCVAVLGTHPAERLRHANEVVDASNGRHRAAPPRMTLVIAHRGACAKLPENSLAAFQGAIEVGADYVEFDVHASPDGSLVVCHDAPRGGESRSSRQSISSAAGSGSCASSRRPGGTDGTTSSTEPSRSSRRCGRRVFDPRALRAVRGRRVLQHVGHGVSIRAAARYAWGVGFHDRRVTKRGLAKARSLGVVTTVYTVNDAARMKELAALGVDGIFSDRPDLLRRTLAALPG